MYTNNIAMGNYINSLLKPNEQVLTFLDEQNRTSNVYTLLLGTIFIGFAVLWFLLFFNQILRIVGNVRIIFYVSLIIGFAISAIICFNIQVLRLITNQRIITIHKFIKFKKAKSHAIKDITALYTTTDNKNKQIITYNLNCKDVCNVSNVLYACSEVYDNIYDLAKKYQEQDKIENPEKYITIKIIDIGTEKQELLDYLKAYILLKDKDFYNVPSEIIVRKNEKENIEELFKEFGAKIEVISN